MTVRTPRKMARSLRPGGPLPRAGRMQAPRAPSPASRRRKPFGLPTASRLIGRLLLLAAVAVAAPAMAADLQVYPVRIALAPDAPTAVLTLINRGDTDTLLQLSVVAWSQDSGGDKLEPTRDILANPGVFLLKGGEQQIARFALRVPEDVKERSYRIVVQEVPRQRVVMGFSTILRMLIPVFVPTPNPTVAMAWCARQVDGGVEIAAHNDGNVHVQV